MFRNMLREKQALSQEECVHILKSEPRGVLSVLGDNDYPYGLPIDFWYDPESGKIYFHCGKKGHKLDAIFKNDKVSFCVYDQGFHKDGHWSLNIRSVIVFGRIQIVDDPQKAIDITRKLSFKYTQDTQYIEDEIRQYARGLVCLELNVEHMTGKLVNEA